jgi:hypothetical protein
MPVGAQFLSVLDIFGTPTIFAMVEQDEKLTEVRKFHRIRTGFPINVNVDDMRYTGSFMIPSFGHVFHVFEEKPSSLDRLGKLIDLSVKHSVDGNNAYTDKTDAVQPVGQPIQGTEAV